MEFDTGNRPDPAGGSGGGTGYRPPGASAAGGAEFDLSDPVASFIRTVRSLITAPAAFFRTMPKTGSLVNPLAFAIICSLIAALPAAVLVLLFGIISAASGDPSAATGGIVGVLVAAVFALIFIPIGTVVGLFIGSALFHLLVLAFVRPSHAGFGATLRVFAYAAFANIFTFLTFIPLLGILVGLAIGVYTVVLSIIGIREAHATTTGRAAVVILAPVLVLFVLGLIISVIIAIAIAGAGAQ